MAKSPDAFRTISEVSDWLDAPAHVLRFWESRFSQIKPVKRAGGRRYYRPNDMLLLGGIRRLLHDDGITIKGVQKILREKGVKYVSSLCLEPLNGEQPEAAATTAPQAEFTPIEDILTEDQDTQAEAPEIAAIAEVASPQIQTPEEFEPVDSRIASFSRRRPQAPAEVADSTPPPENPAPEAPTAPHSTSVRPDILAVPEIDDATQDERIVALYQRLHTLRNRLQTDIQAGR